jgi:protein-tyrosine phosphatase
MRLYWALTPAGRLATAAAPRGETLPREVDELVREGVGVVVSALEPIEVDHLGLDDERRLLEAAGVRFVHFPVPDFAVPADLATAHDLLEELAAELLAHNRVVVHCRGGIGRCSTLAASLLTRLGAEPEEAMDTISEARGVRVPETSAQRMWVHSQAAMAANPRSDP